MLKISLFTAGCAKAQVLSLVQKVLSMCSVSIEEDERVRTEEVFKFG
jgi:hypothetical protein